MVANAHTQTAGAQRDAIGSKLPRKIRSSTAKAAAFGAAAAGVAPGMAQVGMGGSLDSIQEPGTLVSLFNSSDPIVRRSIFGISRRSSPGRRPSGISSPAPVTGAPWKFK